MSPRVVVVLFALSVACSPAAAPSAPAPAPASHEAAPPREGAQVVVAPPPAALEVAVTVDDLPSHGPVFAGTDRLSIAERMLAVLRAHRMPPVYGFVNGQKVERDPASEAVLRRWVEAGYPLGNHTYSHISLNEAEPDAYIADLEKGEAILTRLDPGGSAWKVFRYPYLFEGNTLEKRGAIRAYLKSHGYTIAEVTIDAEDWAYNPPFARCAEKGDAAALAELRRGYVRDHIEELRYMREVTRALAGRDVKHVLLLHIGVADADALDEMLTGYEKEGVKWIGLREALADPFYEEDPGVAVRFGAALPYLHVKARGAESLKLPPRPRKGVLKALDEVCK